MVTIGDQPQADACYQSINVPDPDITIADDGDDAPSSSSATTEDGCGRTLTVMAVDACGNEGTASRTYLIGQPVNLEITGAEDGELVPDAQIEWSVVGNDGCAPNITATHSRDGVDLGEYPKGALLDQPGNYSVTIQAINCVGVPSAFTRNFVVNEPPVVVPIPGGHPKRDPNDPSRYLVKEGTALTVNGSASTAPENDDSVAAFEWDWTSKMVCRFQRS